MLESVIGVCAVLLTKNGAERTLVANLSAANHFTTDHLLKPENERRLSEADIIYITVSNDIVSGIYCSHKTYNVGYNIITAKTSLLKWD